MHSRSSRFGLLIAVDAVLAYLLVTALSSGMFVTALMLAVILTGAISETATFARTHDNDEDYLPVPPKGQNLPQWRGPVSVLVNDGSGSYGRRGLSSDTQSYELWRHPSSRGGVRR